MKLTITTVDAFTNIQFGGNPAAVTVLPEARPDHWMQQLAREMNLSETAYLQKRSDGDYDLRWFTPTVEVDLCGHATLASAHVLWASGALPVSETARFHTKSGVLTAIKIGEWIQLDFPGTPITETAAPAGLLDALPVQPLFIGKSKFDYLIEISEAELRALKPDFSKLAKVEDCRGVMVTSRSSDSQFDFLSRFFAPASGINEDPVTGSAHCALTPYWAEKLNSSSLSALQASERGGHIKVELKGGRVLLSGQAVTILTATADL